MYIEIFFVVSVIFKYTNGSNATLKQVSYKIRKLHGVSDAMWYVSNDAVDKYNLTFEERAREDTFKMTNASENPYSVLVIAREGKISKTICSGSLLTDEWVLTAAHCLTVPGMDGVDVYAGGNSYKEYATEKPANNSQTRESSRYLPHPAYSRGSDYDIGLVKVYPKFNMTETVNTVNISTQPWTYHSYHKCVFTGFGDVLINKWSPQDKVRKTHVLELKKPCICSYMLRAMVGWKKTKRYICSKPKEDVGVCQGDSGGGLVCDGEVKAVVMLMVVISNMATCEISEFHKTPAECGTKNTLGVFEDTCPFLRWINKHVHLFNDSQISEKCIDSGSQHFRPTAILSTAFIFVSLNTLF